MQVGGWGWSVAILLSQNIGQLELAAQGPPPHSPHARAGRLRPRSQAALSCTAALRRAPASSRRRAWGASRTLLVEETRRQSRPAEAYVPPQRQQKLLVQRQSEQQQASVLQLRPGARGEHPPPPRPRGEAQQAREWGPPPPPKPAGRGRSRPTTSLRELELARGYQPFETRTRSGCRSKTRQPTSSHEHLEQRQQTDRHEERGRLGQCTREFGGSGQDLSENATKSFYLYGWRGRRVCSTLRPSPGSTLHTSSTAGIPVEPQFHHGTARHSKEQEQSHTRRQAGAPRSLP